MRATAFGIGVMIMIFSGARRFGLLSQRPLRRAASSVAMRKAALRLPVFTTAVVSAIALAGSSAAGATDPIPLQLQGQWAIPTPSQGGTEYLKLEDSHFEFSHHNPSTGTAKGQVSVSGNTITFGNGSGDTVP